MTMPVLAAGHVPTAAEFELLTDAVDQLRNPPRLMVRQTTAQSVSNVTWTALTFTTEDLDSHNGHSTTTNTSRYTCQVAGWYQLSGKIAWTGNVTGRRVSAWYKNGAEVPATQQAIIATSTNDVEHPAPIFSILLALNDYVELYAYQESGGALSTISTFPAQPSYMAVMMIAAV